MEPPPLLTPDVLDRELESLAAWSRVDGALTRTLRFDDFAAAFGFMAEVAIVAEKHNHHPEWSNTYNRVSIVLTTHDAGGVTAHDIGLARVIDECATGRTIE